MLSLWALVNLQLDTWHGSAAADTDHFDLVPLARWLKDLSVNDDLLAFEHGAGSVPAFRQKLLRLHRFINFRHLSADPDQLSRLLKRLKEQRTNGAPAVAVPELADLARAAQPLDNGESLPQAAILLRYVVLLSYQNEGAESSPVWVRKSRERAGGFLPTSPARSWRRSHRLAASGTAAQRSSAGTLTRASSTSAAPSPMPPRRPTATRNGTPARR